MSAKVSKFVLFWEKLLRFTLFWEQFDKFALFWVKSIKILVKVSPESYSPPLLIFGRIFTYGGQANVKYVTKSYQGTLFQHLSQSSSLGDFQEGRAS